MGFILKKTFIFPALVVVGLSGCADTPEQTNTTVSTNTIDHIETDTAAEQAMDVYDPFQSFNRVMWDINYDYLDPYLVRPVSLAYVDYVPTPIRSGISHFLANLDEPASMVNSLLMQNPKAALAHFNRFWINSIFGLAGIFDIASLADINNPGDRSFSDTTGYYGLGNGPYFMVPGYGPTTLRETTDLVDDLYPMLSYLNFWQGLAKWALEGMEDRAALVKQEALLKNSPDPYIFTRDAYIQYKDFLASDGKATVEKEAQFDDSYLDEIDSD
ncbi:putative phospholipid-binding lipoprotein MlaA [Photobacterium damselae subsp. piscicida]|uniref:Phospholipid-binding lipoprotein MlaA n=1 Tax=Photobacterium damsela subsp. piscicida TaxID=38294 RepID=A0A1Q9H6Q5_PHODP|nr:VacJ family lipoprotein [Photobacterium damselae]MBE8129773.1 VacJ family lipoprotein [Photobacterium damselae subsp. piscicida]OBU46229.1 ABC transporter [Photobacterium damselae]OLQ83416.1 ABC transporter [Photobacterium damselae subsp. piscicida]QOD51969.1 VacJ family lipoprotein [Photobacterium damselae subsp. piscicida]